MLSLFLLTIEVGKKDFATCLPRLPPRPVARPRHPVNMPRGFQQWIDITSIRGLGKR
jgi:hypothetical protein